MTLKDFLPYLSIVMVIVSFYIGRLSSSKSEGKSEGTILTKIDILQHSMNKMEMTMTNYSTQITSIDRRLYGTEKDLKNAFQIIEEIKQDISNGIGDDSEGSI